VLGLADGRLRIPRGAPLDILARVEGVVPDNMRLRYMDAQQSRFEEQMAQREDGAFRSSFAAVSEGFEFQVRGGDGVTEWIEVQVLPRPEVDAVTLSVRLPAYIGGPPVRLDDGSRYDVLRGSELQISGSCSLPIARAACRYEGQELTAVECAGTTNFALCIPADQLASGSYELLVYSTDEVANDPPRLIPVSVRKDAAPDSRLELDGIGRIALSRARIPATFAIRDAYGLTAASVEVALLSDAAEPLRESSHAIPLSGGNGRRSVEGAHVIEARDLEARQGQTLLIEARGQDANTIDGPGIGVSLRKTVRFVGDEEFQAELLTREASLQRLLRTVMGAQQQMLDVTRLLRSRLARGKQASPPPHETELLSVEKQQQREAQRLAGLAGQAHQLAAEVFNNRLETEPQPIHTRLRQAVAQPLAALCEQALPETMADIAACRQAQDGELAAGLLSLEMRQRLMLRVLGQVVANLRTEDDMMQLAQELRQILEAQKRLADEAGKQAESAAEELFE
jgi:hypothetical protein